LVYVPSEDEVNSNLQVDLKNISSNSIYKMVSCTGKECHFIPSEISSLIKQYDSKTKVGELGSLNKDEKTLDYSKRIKEVCWKLKVDRLGNIKNITA